MVSGDELVSGLFALALLLMLFTEGTHPNTRSLIRLTRISISRPSLALLSTLWFTVCYSLPVNCRWRSGSVENTANTLQHFSSLVHFQYARIFLFIFSSPLFFFWRGGASFPSAIAFAVDAAALLESAPTTKLMMMTVVVLLQEKTLHCRFKCDKREALFAERDWDHDTEAGREWVWPDWHCSFFPSLSGRHSDTVTSLGSLWMPPPPPPHWIAPAFALWFVQFVWAQSVCRRAEFQLRRLLAVLACAGKSAKDSLFFSFFLCLPFLWLRKSTHHDCRRRRGRFCGHIVFFFSATSTSTTTAAIVYANGRWLTANC